MCASAAAQQRFDSVTIEAERYVFDAARNVVEASGQVKVTAADVTLTADKLTYDVKTGVASAEGQVIIIEPKREFSGREATYNFGAREGSVREVQAWDETLGVRLYLRGGEVEIKPASWILRDARISTTLEDEPNYQVTAREVELVPGDRWYARDVKLYMFGHKILSRSEYSRSLVHPEKFVLDLLPSIAYTPEDSFYLEYDQETRVGGDIWLRGVVRLSPVTGLGGRASAEFRPSRGNAYAAWGFTEDPKDPFYTALRVSRSPELGVSYPLVSPRRGLDVSADILWGQYREHPTGVTTWRRSYGLIGGHSDLPLGSSSAWRYEFGLRQSDYGTGESYRWGYGGAFLRHRFSEDLRVSVGYLRYFVRGSTPFQWDDVDIPHELRASVQVPLMGRFSVKLVGRYDLDQGRLRDQAYSLLYRDSDFIYSAQWRTGRRDVLFEIKLPLRDEWF